MISDPASALMETLAGCIVLGWVFHLVPARRKLERHLYLSYALGALFCAGSIWAELDFGGLWIATLEPFGVMLPALCLRSSARKVGWNSPDVPRVDLIVLAALMGLVVLGSFGVVPVFAYGWFYSGVGPAGLAVALAFWALWRKQGVVLIAVLLAQIFWLLDIGSSNFYDQIAHLVFIPAFLVSAFSPKR